jgi:hypothetical protein
MGPALTGSSPVHPSTMIIRIALPLTLRNALPERIAAIYDKD